MRQNGNKLDVIAVLWVEVRNKFGYLRWGENAHIPINRCDT